MLPEKLRVLFGNVRKLTEEIERDFKDLKPQEKPFQPEKLTYIYARTAEYQPNGGDRSTRNPEDPQTAVCLADIPVGEIAKIFVHRRTPFEAKVLEVTPTSQGKNEMVRVGTKHGDNATLAAGTAAIRLTYEKPIRFRQPFKSQNFD